MSTIIKFIYSAWGRKVFRFIVIGVINTITDVTILNLLVFALSLEFIYANLVSASISISLSYFWNHYLVFRHKKPISPKLFIRFFLITGVGILALQSLVIYLVEHSISNHQIVVHLGVSITTAKFIRVNSAKVVAVLISMIWNFFLYNFAVFKEDKEEEGVVPY